MNQDYLKSIVRPGSRVVVAALVPTKGDENRSLIEALKKAVEQVGGAIVGSLIQRRGVSRSRRPGGAARLSMPLHSGTVIGKGKVAELAEMSHATQADVIIFCNVLSDSQKCHLERAIGIPVFSFLENTGTSATAT